MTTDDGLVAASFLAQVLGLSDTPAAIVDDLDLVSAEPPVSIWAIEVQSSAGPAAFLVYVYDLLPSTEHEDGAMRLESDLAVLNRAASLDAPGPRLAAEATIGDFGLVLVTTPGFLGATELSPAASGRGKLKQGVKERAVAAEALQTALKQVNDRARTLRSLLPDANDPNPALGEAERALTLFLLDDRSLADFTAVVRQLIGLSGERSGGK